MRKLIATALLVIAATAGYSQDYKDVIEKLQQNNYTEARAAIDKYAVNPKATAGSDYWYFRASAYEGLGKAGDTAASREAIRAISRYYELEQKVKDENLRYFRAGTQGNNHALAIGLYSNAFNAGVKSFQGQQWAAAERNFARALDAFEMLRTNKLIAMTFDTTSTLYAGYAAQNAQDLPKAASYYTQIVDKRIPDTTMVGAYEFLVSYYIQKKDEANAKKYLEIGKQVFPGRPNWVALELQGMSGDRLKKLARMADLSKADPKNADLAQDYTAELFNYTYGPEKPTDYTARQEELTRALQSLIDNHPDVVYGYYVMTQHLSNQIYDIQQARNAIKSTKPEDIKKKTDLDKQIMPKFDQMFPFASKAASIYEAMGANLKPAEKANYRNVLNNIVDYYNAKKQPAEAKKYEEKSKALVATATH